MEKFLGKNLLFLRKRKGLQQSQMLAELDVKGSTWSMYENGNSQPPLDVLMKISNYFEIPENILLRIDLRANAHLIEELENQKNKENAHVNSHGIAHVTPKKEEKSPPPYNFEMAINQALNDPESPYGLLPSQIHELSSKIANLTVNMSRRMDQMEDKIKALSKEGPKK